MASKGSSGFGYLIFVILAVVVTTALMAPPAPPDGPDPAALSEAREATGGAQTRESIMARQAGQTVDLSFRETQLGNPDTAAPASAQLGTLGGASDSDLFRQLRFGAADVTVSGGGPAADVLIQDGGMAWLTFREGPLLTYGGGFLIAVLLGLALFYGLRGKIRIDGEKTGETIRRFTGIERFGHWLLAVSFVLLGITGLISLAGRPLLIPLMGHEAFSVLALGSKWIHNNVAWPFMLALVMVFVQWVWHNIPTVGDVRWLARGGGLFGGGHPPAKKFNAGQKLIFWSVVILGGSISVSGLALLFPFEMNLFAPTFSKLNDLGVPALLGRDPFPVALLPHEEMQLSQAWHGIVGIVFMGIVMAHIYLGSVGMEGAFDAMGSGQVEKQWAREHHSEWYTEVTGEPVEAHPTHDRTPAE